MFEICPDQQLVLASASSRRSALLEQVGLTFQIVPAQIDEEGVKIEDTQALVRELSLQKAQKVAESVSSRSWILAADTLVELRGQVFGKPRDATHCKEMLMALSGTVHNVHGGVALLCPAQSVVESASITSKIHFYPLDEDLVEHYIASGEPSDKAGGYAIQELGQLFIKSIEGSYSNIVGLDLALVMRKLLGHKVVRLREK